METKVIDDQTIDKKNNQDRPTDEQKDYDIITALELTGHITTKYPNGLFLGVRMEAIPGTRGVHVDIVFVLDLRAAIFGKGGLAMRAAVLETVSRDLDRVLNDIGLGEWIEDHVVLTPFGRVRLPLMHGKAKGSRSLMHETRTVYVITENAKPIADFSWLTDSCRILTEDQFALIRQSDARSRLPELQKNVEQRKWAQLERGMTQGWFGVLALVALILGLSSLFFVILAGSSSILLPMIVSATSGAIGGWLLSSSRQAISSFVDTLTKEQKRLQEIGDASRVSKSIEENEDRLHLIGDLNFIVSPLIAAAANAIGNTDVDKTVTIACSVLDECVRLSPFDSDSKTLLMGDTGLRKFIGLFEYLGGNIEEERLSLAYVGLSGHLSRPIAFGEAVAHLTELVNSLYDLGALRPDIKASIDDHLNYKGLEEALQEIDKEIASDSESPPDDTELTTEVSNHDKEKESSDPTKSIEEDELSDMMLQASIDEDVSEADIVDDENIVVVAADIVAGQQKMRNTKPKDSTQLSLLDDYELVTSSSDSSPESGSIDV
ncbi:hypothetical protein EU527_02510 [Candidatus Thorarchaeota archaeon]|nr:MAG: hypothetical protein EU527_02510 [Candidatus Thorarchaeota archaeon]